MYYPSLFETAANPYSAFNTRPYIKNGVTDTIVPCSNNNTGNSVAAAAAHQRADLCLLPSSDKKTMISTATAVAATTPNGTASISSLVESLRLPSFCAPPPTPYTGHHASTHENSLISSYAPSETAASNHLSAAENAYNSTMLREQSSLMEVAPHHASYGIGSLPAPPTYAPHYYINPPPPPVLNAAGYKISNAYPTAIQNNFYRSANGPYNHHAHHQATTIYNESFMPDYLNRTMADTSKPLYSSLDSAEHSSFSDHLKRLQESFQSKSSSLSSSSSVGVKCNDCSSSSINGQSVPENIYYSSYHCQRNHSEHSINNDNNHHFYRLVSSGSVIKSDHDQSDSHANVNKDQEKTLNGYTSMNISSDSQSKSYSQQRILWNPLIGSHRKSLSSSQHSSEIKPQNDHSNHNESSTNLIRHNHNHHHQSALNNSIEFSNLNLSSTSSSSSSLNNRQQNEVIIMKPNDENDQLVQSESEKSQSSSPMILKPKNHHNKNKQTNKLQHNEDKSFKVNYKSNEQLNSNSDESKNNGCIQSPWHLDDHSSCELDGEDEKNTSQKHESNYTRTDESSNSKTKDCNNKMSKKSVYYVRRRRFRSGLDMIRNSRKKTSKTKIVRKESHKRETTVDTRPESFNRRFVVNKSLGETLLHRSARNNRLDVVRHCLESEACDVNARDNAGYTPLHECSSRGNLEIARLLLQHSADVNASATGGIRPLHDAIENNHIELVRLLLSYGADPHISTYSGTTPLQLSRSKAMSKFLEGFYSDISTDRSTVDDMNVWKFKCDNSLENSGFDIFGDLSSDDQKNSDDVTGIDDDQIEFEFDLSTKPFLNLYTFLHKPNQCPFYLLWDVIKTLKMTRESLITKYPLVRISKISQSDFETNALIIQLERRRLNNKLQNKNKRISIEQQQQCHHDEIEIIYQDEQIQKILDVETAVISS